MIVDKNLIKLINETISDYDFLGMIKLKEEREFLELIENEEFQKQFITDFILGKSEKYNVVETVDAKITGDYSTDYLEDQNNYINIEYVVKMQYKYDPSKEPVGFELYFGNSERINISLGGEQDSVSGADWGRQEMNNSWITYLDWSKIDVTLFTIEGDEIEFKAFKRAPDNIRNLFVREFTKDLITSEIGLEFREQ